MYRHPFDLVRLFFSLFQDLPQIPRSVYLPGAVLLTGYPILSVALGAGHADQAFVTAFVMALAVRIGMGFEGLLRRLLTHYSVGSAAFLAITFAVVPMAVLMNADDPAFCQRMQSLFYVAIGAIFMVDVMKGRVSTAASLWPDADMRGHLPNLTRMMVIYNASFLVLNETVIQSLHMSHWMVFWAVLPVIGHMVLRAMVLTVINLDDSGQPV